MTTDVINQLAGTLDAELQKARENLRGVDSNIKKLFGKDAFELNNFGGSGRGRRSFGNSQEFQDEDDDYEQNNYSRGNRKRDDRDRSDRYDDEPGEKRRRVDSAVRPPPVVIGPRIRPRYDDDKYDSYSERDRDRDRSRDRSRDRGSGRRLQSRIVSSSKEKSREEVLAEQSKDRKGRDRNRRMFGALLGTLQRFKQEETKLKNKEEKRAQIEAKLDEAANKEREEVKKEKQQLIRDRKLQITEIKRLELKRRRIAELESWEAKTRYLTNFIRTEAKPHIFYLPKILNPIMECRLDQSKQYVTEMIASKRKLVLEDLEDFEQRSRRYWEGRVDGESKKDEVDPMEEDMELELKEIMKMEDGEDFTVTVFESKKESETSEIKTSEGEEKQQQKEIEEEKQGDEEINLPLDKEEEEEDEEEQNVDDSEKTSNNVKVVRNNTNDERMDEQENQEEEQEEEENGPSRVERVEYEEEEDNDDDDDSRINEESKENFDTSN